MTKAEIAALQAGRETDAAKHCLYCSVQLVRKYRECNRDWHGRKYCSMRCKNRHFNETKGRNPAKWVVRDCQHCGRKFDAPIHYVKRGQMKYCSPSCAAFVTRKHKVQTFNGVAFYLHTPTGYYVANNGLRMNRAVWEFYNGAIPDGHIVHHVNEIKSDNRIENLELKEWGEHTRHHNTSRHKAALAGSEGER